MRVRLPLIVSGFVLISGCASNTPSVPSSDFQPPVIDSSPEARALILPFDAYKPEDSHLESTLLAVDILTRKCLRDKGFDAVARPRVEVIDAPNRRRYGVIEINVAQRAGYRPTLTRDQKILRDAFKSRPSNRDPKEATARRECVRQSNGRILVRDAQSPLLAQLEHQSFERARKKDHRVMAALRNWRTCMVNSGQRKYVDPIAAVADDRWNTQKPGELEINAAIADVACKEKARVVEIWSQAETRFQLAAIKRHHVQFSDLKRALQKEKDTILRVIEGGPLES